MEDKIGRGEIWTPNVKKQEMPPCILPGIIVEATLPWNEPKATWLNSQDKINSGW